MNNRSLEEKFFEYQSIPFPKNSDDMVISEVHDELAEYDGYIAGLILSFAQGKVEIKDKIIYDLTFEERLAARLKEKPELKKEVQNYLDYLHKIKTLIDLVHSS